MSKASLSIAIDRKQISKADMQQIFDDIEAAINTNLITPDQERKNAIRRRHLKLPPDIFLHTKKTGTSLFSGTLNKAASWNWTNAVLEFTPVTGSIDSNPVCVIRGMLRCHDWEAHSYEIGIGYSEDGGSSYTLIPGTNRHLGYRDSYDKPLYTGTVNNPVTGAGGYWPPSVYSHHEVKTDAALINISGMPTIQDITHLALGIRVNHADGAGNGTKNVHALDVGQLYLIGRSAA